MLLVKISMEKSQKYELLEDSRGGCLHEIIFK